MAPVTAVSAPDPERGRRLARARFLRGRRARGGLPEAGPLGGERGDRALWLTGELDAFVAGQLERRLREHAVACHDAVVVVDLSGVTFIDCSGLDALVTAHSELAEQDRLLYLRSIPPTAQHLFRVLRRMGDYPLLEQALGAAHDVAEPAPVAVDADGPPSLAAVGTELRDQLRAQIVRARADGLLMGLHGCDAAQAHLLLGQVAAHHHVAPEDLAERLVADTPTPGPGSAAADLLAPVEVAARAVLGDRRVPSAAAHRPPG